MPLLPAFRGAAVARGHLPDDTPVTAAAAFALVRDMPYERASSRDPAVTVDEWRGTCSGKHYLLRALFEELGVPTVLLACTHAFTLENAPWAPPDLRAILEGGPVPDVHNFLRIQPFPGTERADEWTTVDATWPLAAASLGLPVNERFELGRDQRVACDPIEVFHVPDDIDPQELKERLLEIHVGDQGDRRERFLAGMMRWLAAELAAR